MQIKSYLRIEEKDMKIVEKEEAQFCKVCFSKIDKRNFYNCVKKNLCLCDNCMNKISAKFHYFKVERYSALAVFDYDSELKKLIYQFKGCFDIELRQIFLERYVKEIELMYKGYVVVPAPSYEEENKIRQFNHVIEIFKLINLEMEPCIEKTTPFKQAEHKSSARSKIGQHLKIKDGNKLKGKKVLIVDDVYTTGSTIKAMISLVEPLKPKKIKILVISKTVLKPIDT